MSAAKKQLELHPLLKEPIRHAYALVPDPKNPLKFFAVHLTNVTAQGLSILEPSDRPEPATYGLERIQKAQQRRHTEKKWTR